MKLKSAGRILLILPLSAILFIRPYAQTTTDFAYQSLRWRSIGPYRGGRTVGASGVPGQPNIFYIGVNNGGVWKTTDFGRTWTSVFDHQSTGSIGCVAVAPSQPDTLYVGSGEGLHRPDLSVGNGIYRSANGGKTWEHLGLRDGQQIPQIAIDPHNANRLFVAVLGHPYGPNTERGIFRSTDGGKTFQKVLYVDENTGGDDVAIDPENSNIVYATLWQAQEAPWENGEWAGTRGGIFKSTNGGDTWTRIQQGLPADMVQAHIAIAPSDPDILYAAIGTTEPNRYGTGSGMGIFRSQDAGAHWEKISEDPRPEARIGGGDVPVLKVDPKNPNVVYSASIVLWKSVDGGRTWKGIRGAPGGDDYQNLWINPLNPQIMLVTGDQGAIITVNGGASWSSWYNQPTAQLYHVAADNEFPYNLYSGQQESGSVGIASRGDDGEITFRDWHPVGAQEYGYVAPDPLHPWLIYGGKLTKYNKITGEVQNVAPNKEGIHPRFLRTAPVVFSPVDPKRLYYAGNILFETEDGGNHWTTISPDLSRPLDSLKQDIPSCVDGYMQDARKHMIRSGVIYAVAPSPLDVNRIWAGTDDGLIQTTRDGGKTWQNVTPTSLTAWSKVSIMDAGHFSTLTAYAAINRLRCNDLSPYIYKTHDGGKTWVKIVNGLPQEPINAVREDSKKPGLLFAASETATYVSFDDGSHWHPLRLNMPATSIRDLIIKDNDLVVATHGRGFWILDDMAPLRQIPEQGLHKGMLFTPEMALRVRWDKNTDTPLPPDEPAGQNPPDGAIIDYYLNDNAKGPVTLDILDSRGQVVRHYSSLDTLYHIPPENVPDYWIRPQQVLSAQKGPHRFIWDLHYDPLPLPVSFSIGAVYHNTPAAPNSPWVMPGRYTVRLTAEGHTMEKPLIVKMDPRVKTPLPDLEKQFIYSMTCYRNQQKSIAIQNKIKELNIQISRLLGTADPSVTDSLKTFSSQLKEIRNSQPGESIVDFNQAQGQFSYLMSNLQGSDMTPNAQVIRMVKQSADSFNRLLHIWHQVGSIRLAQINRELGKKGLFLK